jgi:hypothetical protein
LRRKVPCQVCKSRRYKEILVPRNKVIPKSMDFLDPAISADTEQIKLQRRNKQGYTDLILSMDTVDTSGGKMAFSIVCNQKTKAY